MTTHDRGTLEAAETPVTLPTDVNPRTDLGAYGDTGAGTHDQGTLSGDC